MLTTYIPTDGPAYEPKGSGELKTNNKTCYQYIGCIGGYVTSGVDVIATSHTTSNFNMADVNV